MRKFSSFTKEASTVTEERPGGSEFKIKPMTGEEAERIDQVLKEARELGKRILARRKGKPLPPSWRIIRQDRAERYKKA